MCAGWTSVSTWHPDLKRQWLVRFSNGSVAKQMKLTDDEALNVKSMGYQIIPQFPKDGWSTPFFNET